MGAHPNRPICVHNTLNGLVCPSGLDPLPGRKPHPPDNRPRSDLQYTPWIAPQLRARCVSREPPEQPRTEFSASTVVRLTSVMHPSPQTGIPPSSPTKAGWSAWKARVRWKRKGDLVVALSLQEARHALEPKGRNLAAQTPPPRAGDDGLERGSWQWSRRVD